MKQPRRSKLRERLLTQAGLLFAERGYDAVTIREVATAARVQLSDIYRHFDDKRALYKAACTDARVQGGIRYEKVLRSTAPPARKLLLFMALLYRDLSEDPRYSRLFIRELLERDAEGIAELADDHFRGPFMLCVDCLRELGHKSDADSIAYTMYVIAVGNVHMVQFGRVIPVRGIKWEDPVAMARFIMAKVLPAIDWSKQRIGSLSSCD